MNTFMPNLNHGRLALLFATLVGGSAALSPLSAEIIEQPPVIKEAALEVDGYDDLRGSLEPDDLTAAGDVFLLTFDDDKIFPASTGTPPSLPTLELEEQTISFHAPNPNWWRVLPDNPWMYFSARQGLSLRGLAIEPDQLYFTFQEPVSHVGLVLCNILAESGNKVVFYSDADGKDVVEEVEVSGGENKVEADGTPRGYKVFVGAHSPQGIRRVGFSFVGENVDQNYQRGFDNLAWKNLEPK